MAGYQGGADATVIQAVKSASAIPEGYHASPWDYKGYVEGIANIAGFIVSKVNAASERASGVAGFEEGINKEFWNKNNTDYFVDLKQQMNEWSKTMSMSLPFTKAFKDAKRNHDNGMASLTKILEDQVTLEEMIKRVKDCSGPNQSGYNDAALKSLMEEINGGSGMFDNSVRFTEDGIVVMGPDGMETLLEDLQSPASKLDGKATTDIINTQITDAIGFKSKGLWNERNRYLTEQNLRGHLDAQTSNVIGSAAFDYEHYTANGTMSFADHLMATSGPYNEAFEEWKRTGGIGVSERVIKETKMNLAQQLWDDNELMKDEYLNWIMNDVLDFGVSEQKINKSGSGDGGDDYSGSHPGDDDGDGDEGTDWGKNAISKINKLSARGAQTWGDISGTTGRGTKEEGKLLLNYDGSRGEVIKKLNSEYKDIGFSFSEVGGIVTGDALEIKFVNKDTGATHYYSKYLQANNLGTAYQEYDNWTDKSDLKTTNEIINWMTMMVNDVNAGEANITYK